MSQYMTRAAAVLTLSAALIAGCAKDKTSDTLAQDTSLNRDIQLANADTAAQPTLKDVPVASNPTPSPATTAPAPRATNTPTTRTTTTTTRRTTTAPAPVRTVPQPTTGTTSSGNTVTRTGAGSEAALGTISAGSTVNLASGSRICTNTNHVGDRFNATVTEAVVGSNGAVIPVGATASVEVTALKRSENANDNVTMGLRVVSFTFGGRTYPVSATTSYAKVDKVRNEPQSKDVQKVAVGAVVGGILGHIIGKSTKGTVIGAATGAAAGAGAAAATANYEGCVPSGGRITVSLNSATQIHT
jgi:hypothetical protein